MPISGKDMRKLFLHAGYVIVPGGKGSHWKLRKGKVRKPSSFLSTKSLKRDLNMPFVKF